MGSSKSGGTIAGATAKSPNHGASPNGAARPNHGARPNGVASACAVVVPSQLILTADLTAATKKVFIVGQLRGVFYDKPESQRGLAAWCHLSCNTIAKATRVLALRGWPAAQEGRAAAGGAAVSPRKVAAWPLDDRVGVAATTRQKCAPATARQDPATTTADECVTRAGQVFVPAGLLTDRHVGAQAVVLYGAVQILQGFDVRQGQSQGQGGERRRRPADAEAPCSCICTYAELARLTGRSLPTVRRALRQLAAGGWLRIDQENRRRPLRLTLTSPAHQWSLEQARALERRLNRAPFLGEELMRGFLSAIVDAEYSDNARLSFLTNPFTSEPLELDRHYPGGAAPHASPPGRGAPGAAVDMVSDVARGVGFEFNGPQHYGPTKLFPSQEDLLKQQARDDIKRGICERRGIELVVIRPQDLSLQGMLRKVPSELPRRDLGPQGPVLSLLERAARAYRRKAAA